MCRENISKKKSMEEGKDDNTALLYSLMADEQDNQTDF